MLRTMRTPVASVDLCDDADPGAQFTVNSLQLTALKSTVAATSECAGGVKRCHHAIVV